MKRITLLLVAVMAIAGVCLAGENPVVGTWELESRTETSPDGKTSHWEGRSIKIYSETHFAVVSHGADGAFIVANAGPYTLKGKSLTEKLQNSSNPDAVGAEAQAEASVAGDVLTFTFGAGDGTKIEEIWKRAK
jgi:hypothetical protein